MNRDYLVEQLQSARRQTYDLTGEVRRTKATVWFYIALSVIGWSLFIAAMVVKS